ncbi:hypothetical protein [Lysinibacillus sp. LZ02]|uniref:hypothetical protein n=1 Tax=Lysinibacillus sp. LZ02 TaxID=3420668 RepID=UPI003D359F57
MRRDFYDWENNFVRLSAKPVLTEQDFYAYIRLLKMPLDWRRVSVLVRNQGIFQQMKQHLMKVNKRIMNDQGIWKQLLNYSEEESSHIKRLVIDSTKSLEEQITIMADELFELYKLKQVKLCHYSLLCRLLTEYPRSLCNLVQKESRAFCILQTIYLFELEDQYTSPHIECIMFNETHDYLAEILEFMVYDSI